MIKSGLGEKVEINRAAYFGITECVIDMDKICNGYEFDMYLIQFQWNRCRMTSRFGEKAEDPQSSSFWYNTLRN